MANEPDTISLRDFFTGEIAGLKLYLDTKLDGIENARNLAAGEIDRRLENLNGLHKEMDKLEGTFATAKDLKLVVMQVDNLRINEAKIAGMASQSSLNFVTFISVMGLMIGVVSIVLNFAK